MKKFASFLGIGLVSLIAGLMGGYTSGFAHAALVWGNNSIPYKEISSCASKLGLENISQKKVVMVVNFDNNSIGEVECVKGYKSNKTASLNERPVLPLSCKSFLFIQTCEVRYSE